MIEAGRGATRLVPASPGAPLRRGEDRALQNIIAMYVNAITLKARPPFRPAYIHTGTPENPDRLPRPGLRVVDYARGRAGFSCWRFTREQLQLLLLMRPGSFISAQTPRQGKEEREDRKRKWRGTEIAPNGTWRTQGFPGHENGCR